MSTYAYVHTHLLDSYRTQQPTQIILNIYAKAMSTCTTRIHTSTKRSDARTCSPCRCRAPPCCCPRAPWSRRRARRTCRSRPGRSAGSTWRHAAEEARRLWRPRYASGVARRQCPAVRSVCVLQHLSVCLSSVHNAINQICLSAAVSAYSRT